MKQFRKTAVLLLAAAACFLTVFSAYASDGEISIQPVTGTDSLYSCEYSATPYKIDGYITNSTTGAAISGAKLTFRSGKNKKSGTAYKTVKTSTNGYFSATLKQGDYTIATSKSGFITSYSNYGCYNSKRYDISISPKMSATTWRIVLTWGASPRDLDSHLTGPSGTGRFHVYFSHKNEYYNNNLIVSLDVDDTSSYGPETVTVNFAKSQAGTYKYMVHDYSDKSYSSSNALAKSGARVVVYNGNKQVTAISVPNKYGTLWYVFDLVKSGSTVKLVKRNSMSYQSTAGSVASRGPKGNASGKK